MVSTTVGWVVALVLAYLLGSIPTAYLAGRLLKGKDIREEGDRNPGAGNAYRVIGPKVGIAVGAADIGKAAIAVVVARVVTGSMGAEMAAGVAAVAGHNWSIFLQLRGGRGAASAVGVFIALVPIPAIPLALVSLLLLPIVRSATFVLGLLMIPMPFLVWITGHFTTGVSYDGILRVFLRPGVSYDIVAYSVALPVMVGLRHYFGTRKLRSLKQDQAGGQPLPQG